MINFFLRYKIIYKIQIFIPPLNTHLEGKRPSKYRDKVDEMNSMMLLNDMCSGTYSWVGPMINEPVATTIQNKDTSENTILSKAD